MTSVTLVLTVYNGTGSTVECSAIVITFPVGSNDSSLTQNAGLIAPGSQQPDLWALTARTNSAPGVFDALPVGSGGQLPAGAALTFTFSNIDVSEFPGVAVIGISESTDVTRLVDLVLEKVSARP